MNFINLVLCVNSIRKPMIIALQEVIPLANNEFAFRLDRILRRKKIDVMMIRTKDYCKSVEKDLEEIQYYDFDNPAVIDWDLLKNTLNDIKNKKSIIRRYMFNENDLKNYPYEHEQTLPDVIILRGQFASNLFNDKVFNVSQFDCKKPQIQKIDVEYIDNPDNFYTDFKIMKILFLSKFSDTFKTFLIQMRKMAVI